MIDYVRLFQKIPIHKKQFQQTLCHEATTQDGSVFLWYKFRAVTVRYYLSTQNLVISGKLITLLHDTQVLNFDDIYGHLKDDFLDELNEKINRLFTRPLINLRDFLVTRIDYCFNVETPYVKEYIDFLTVAFRRTNNGHRVNFTEKKGLSGSVYIKNAAEYEKNARYNYTLNVYNKLDRLMKQKRNKQRVTEADLKLAENILRIEIQASYHFLESICKHFDISKRFADLFDYRIAIYAIETVFGRVYRLKPNDTFYTYSEAKKLVRPDSAAHKTLYAAATNHAVTGQKYAQGIKMLRSYGIYPFCLLPTSSPVPHLQNPVQLVLNKAKAFL